MQPEYLMAQRHRQVKELQLSYLEVQSKKLAERKIKTNGNKAIKILDCDSTKALAAKNIF